jgi:hypothetical protein
MFFDGPAERNRLHARIEELERRVAQVDELERRLRLLEQECDSEQDESAPAPDYDRRRAGTPRFGRRATDQLVRSPATDDGDAGREGARLVALEMLDAGYEPEQVRRYLRESFHVNAEDAARAVHGTPAG